MNLQRDIETIERGGAGFVHVDVMDGHFVPNLTIGVPHVKQLKAITNLPLDVHLMIPNPLEQLPWFLTRAPTWLPYMPKRSRASGSIAQSLIHDSGRKHALH